jgi:hypothetical protein
MTWNPCTLHHRCPARTTITLFAIVLALLAPVAFATAPPSHTATIVVRGFDSQGASRTGPFGVDLPDSTIAALAATVGLPTGDVAPAAPNQVAYTDYYGTAPPSYYTAQDNAELDAVTTQYGGGVPRYALIIAKFAKEVMRRSGAQQVNILGVSFGGLVSRWVIEHDVEGLASGGKIARWIVIEGVVAGNWAATNGGQALLDYLGNNFDLATIDLQHMNYAWVDANIHDPGSAVDNPLLGAIPVHFWIPSDDDYNSKALTAASLKPNDGVVLLRDGFFQSVTPQSRYQGLFPTLSAVHATHDSSRQNLGLRAGVAADLFGRRRVTITLTQAYLINDEESSGQEPAEVVFGVKVRSPRALADHGVADPVHELRHDDNNVPAIQLSQGTTSTINLAWFDDLILPGETQLRLDTNVDEIDFDPLYGITENPLAPDSPLADTTFFVSTGQSGTYQIATADWRGVVTVSVTDYPPFDPPPSSVGDWELYD